MVVLSQNDYNLKFTMQFSPSTITYLDITIKINQEGQINTSLFRKPTAGNTILHARSAHPRPLVQSIPFSQYIRLKCNCSMDADFKYEADLLYQRLLARGYTKTTLKKAFKKAITKPRSALLFPEPKQTNSEVVRLITTYSDQHQTIRSTIQKHWHILTTDPTISKYIGSRPEITFRRARSIKDRLV